MVPAGPRQLGQARERGARIRRVVQDARRVDHVEGARLEARPLEVGLDEPHPLEPEASRGAGSERERRAGQVGADDHAIGAGQEQAHLAGAAADLDNPRVAGDRASSRRGSGLRSARARSACRLSRGG